MLFDDYLTNVLYDTSNPSQRKRLMKNPYYAYLLRLWQTGAPSALAWHASLEDPHTRQVRSFGSLEALCNYISGLGFADEETPTPEAGEAVAGEKGE
jgi:hypothetical protein